MWVILALTYLNIDDGNDGLGLVEVPSHPVHRLRDEIQHKIQIHLVFLVQRSERQKIHYMGENNLKSLSNRHFLDGFLRSRV